MTLTSRKLVELEKKETVDHPGTEKLYQIVMNQKPEQRFYPPLVRISICLGLWLLGAFALVCAGWILWSIIKFALMGFVISIP